MKKPVFTHMHFPGSGPVGKRCSDCQHWKPLTAKSVTKKKCGRIKELLGIEGSECPDEAACKYFNAKTPMPNPERLAMSGAVSAPRR